MQEEGMRSILSERFGRLVVQKFLGRNGTANMYQVLCDCGKESVVRRANLLSSITKSCGCLQSEVRVANKTTHGLRKHNLYAVYTQMLQRCSNPKNEQFADYGGRGITVCERWKQGFHVFLEDMGERPTPKHQLDRADNSLGYSPENCKWSTPAQNSSNRRNTLRLDICGKPLTLREISISFNLSYAITRHTFYRHGEASLRKLLKVEG